MARALRRCVAATIVLAATAGCGGARSALPLRHWLVVDAAKRSVAVTLVPAYSGAYGGFNVNGYVKGQAEVVVPVGWRVTVQCRNGGSVPHSCALVPSPGTSSHAIPGASTAPLASGGRASFSFAARSPGVYRIASLVDGDEVSGMWDVFEIARGGSPRVTLLRKPTH